MSARWYGGLHIRGLDRDQTPITDLYCTACHHHERVTGRAKVTDYLRANPLSEHRARCTPTTT
ncbi:transcription factor WhiB [Streptomyces phaeolivaceus]|uniref:Transcription factor WhiB n=1 Tax=Streptomyces phaeolivaceus TaxID=2653200 RepID=A0A5P8K2S0_9ACTN|nr:transcription factor WhiB [Streptomyces phaeolivaceus]QFQ97431.1 transcription factor WhiB [Streptomyces phaeolivaceus]